jgi:hypothetical protein
MLSLQHTPVEPFGGLDNFDVSQTQIIYTTKDPNLPEAWHTKQNVWLARISNLCDPINPFYRYTWLILQVV